MVDARRTALRILTRVETEGAWSSRLLSSQSPPAGAEADDPRDLAFTMELVNGVLRRRRWLDEQIARHASRRLDAIEPDLLQILRLAAYQILFLDRVPAHAAVNEAVTMARQRRGVRPGRLEAGSRFANAVLRALARAERSPAPGPEAPIELLARYHSCPEPLASRWEARLGAQEAGRLMAACSEPAPLGLRPVGVPSGAGSLQAALVAEGVETTPGRWLPGFYVATRGLPQRTAAFDRGEFYIQDEASALVGAMAASALGQGALALDACAAPGGKTLALCERLGPKGHVVAADLRPSRLTRLTGNLSRLGVTGYSLLATDLTEAAPFRTGTFFDLVLVDAPCSGTGVLRRHPELRYRFSDPDLPRLVKTQRALLEQTSRLVAPGGALLYSVCSLEPEEGVEVVADFMSRHEEFGMEDPRLHLPVTAHGLVTPLRGLEGGPEGGLAFATSPHRHGTDGFFAAVLRRQG